MIHNCVWFVNARIVENLKKSQNGFQWTTKHFFGKIISCTCDLHLKLHILNPLNIIFFINWFFKWVLCLATLFSKYQNFESFVWFGFSSSSSNEHVFSLKWACFCCTKSLKLIVWLYAFLLIFFKKNYFKHLITLVYRTQNDIYIVSKLL